MSDPHTQSSQTKLPPDNGGNGCILITTWNDKHQVPLDATEWTSGPVEVAARILLIGGGGGGDDMGGGEAGECLVVEDVVIPANTTYVVQVGVGGGPCLDGGPTILDNLVARGGRTYRRSHDESGKHISMPINPASNKPAKEPLP